MPTPRKAAGHQPIHQSSRQPVVHRSPVSTDPERADVEVAPESEEVQEARAKVIEDNENVGPRVMSGPEPVEVMASPNTAETMTSGPNPGTLIYPYTPVTAAQALAAEIAAQPALAAAVTGNLVTMNPGYVPS